MLWKNLYSVLSCVVELLDEDYIIHCMSTCIQIDNSGSCDHAPLLVIFYVLGEVHSRLVHEFPGPKAYQVASCAKLDLDYLAVSPVHHLCQLLFRFSVQLFISCILQRKGIPVSLPQLHL